MRANSFWIIGILAGIAGGLMALAGLKATTMAVFLLFAAPAAVYIAALGWGTAAGLTAALVATAISFYDGVIAAPVAAGTLLFLPAAWAGHLVNLARRDTLAPGGPETTVWFPISGVLLRMMLALTAGFIITGWAVGFSGERVAMIFSELMGEAFKDNPQLAAPSPEMLARQAGIYASLIPLIVPAIWLMLHVLVIHLCAMIVHHSGRLARPAEDIAANATLPVQALALPVLGVVGMAIASGPLYEIAAVAAGIGIGGFGLIGLAELHYVSRGRPGRGVMLFLSYFLLVLFSFPLLIFAGMGVRRAFKSRNQPPSPPPANINGGPGTPT